MIEHLPKPESDLKGDSPEPSAHQAVPEGQPSAAFLRLLGSGMSRKEIQELLGLRKRFPRGVISRSQLLGMIREENECYAQLERQVDWTSKKPTTTAERVARRVAAKNAFRSHGHLLEEEEYEMLRLQMKEGRSQREIARIMGVTINVLNNRMMETKERLLMFAQSQGAQDHSLQAA